MATFTISPAWAPVSTRRPRILSTKFGDGYEQRGADGIHPDLQSWQLTFGPMPTAEADTIETFFVTNNVAVVAFDWTPPRGAASKFLCRTWSRTASSPTADRLTATFDEVPEP